MKHSCSSGGTFRVTIRVSLAMFGEIFCSQVTMYSICAETECKNLVDA